MPDLPVNVSCRKVFFKKLVLYHIYWYWLDWNPFDKKKCCDVLCGTVLLYQTALFNCFYFLRKILVMDYEFWSSHWFTMTHPSHPTHTGEDVCDAVAMDTRKCYEGSQHPVHVEHRLCLVNHLVGKKCKCEICHEMVVSNYYHCKICNFNLCKRCFLPTDTLLHEHRLDHTDVRYTSNYTKGEWCCDCCGGNNGSGN